MHRQAKNAIRQSLVKNENAEEECPSPTKVCGSAPAEPTPPTEPQDDEMKNDVTVPAEIPERNENQPVDPMEEETSPSEAEVEIPNAFPWSEEDDFQDDDDDDHTLDYSRSKSKLPDDVQNDDEMKDGQTPTSGEVPTDPADQQVLPSNPPAPVPDGGMAPTGTPKPAYLRLDPSRTTERGGAGHGEGIVSTLMPPPPVPSQKKRSRGDHDPYFETLSFPPQVLSDNAIYNRLYRVFKAKKDRSYDVDDKWVKAWQDVKDGRSQLYSMFEKTGYSVDRGSKNIEIYGNKLG